MRLIIFFCISAVKKQGVEWSIKCCYHESGCPYRLPSMEQHEENECKYKPARCPSLTCPVKPAFANVLKHIEVTGYNIDTLMKYFYETNAWYYHSVS